MFDFISDDLFYLLIAAGFAVYAVYYAYKVIRYFLKAQNARKQFYSTHKTEEGREVNAYRWWLIGYLACAVYCFFSAVTLNGVQEQAVWFRLAFSIVGVILTGQAVLAVVKRRIIFADDCFVYEDAIVRWQSVLEMHAQKRLMQKAVDVNTATGKHYTLPADLGKKMHEEHMAYKQRRKKK